LNFKYVSRVAAYGTTTEYVSPEEYIEAYSNFQDSLQKESYYQPRFKFPISFKEIKDYDGKCFLLETDEFATLDQQSQGWTISLSPNLEYDVYLSAPGVSFPTYSSKVNLPQFTLQHRSQTFINFVAEKYIKIRRKGLLDKKEYCNEHSHYHDTVDCEKQCFLDSYNITCQPSMMNVFDNQKLPICKTKEEEDFVFKSISSNKLKTLHCKECLNPCNDVKYGFNVVTTRFESNETKLRINGLKFYVKGTEERLLFSFKDLLVSVGGFLGLFIGLSLNDVLAFLVDSSVQSYRKIEEKLVQ